MSAIDEEDPKTDSVQEDKRSSEELFQAVENYPWNTDLEFQGGLQAILGTSSNPNQIQQLTLRARTFFYARKFSTPIDFDAYKTWRAAQTDLPPLTAPVLVQQHNTEPEPLSSEEEPPAPYPQTFQEIVRLITSGEPIPGIKDIPPTVLEDKASKPAALKRKKPWEKEVIEINGDGEGTFGDRRDDYIVQETV